MDANDWKRYLFTFIDSFSKFAFVFPSVRRDSESVLKNLKELIYSEGPWKIFHSDNGGEFTSNNIKSFLEEFNIRDVQGRPYRPQTQGQIERFNRTIKSRIRKYLRDNNSSRYIDILLKILYQYNTSKHKATKIAPFVLFRGFDPLSSNWGDMDQHFDIQQLRDQYLKYTEGYRNEYNNRISAVELHVGDLVLIAKEFNPQFLRRRRPLESYYKDGVYTILVVYTSYVLVKINETDDNSAFQVHKSLIKKLLS
ncbi:Gag-Pol polyprotein [Cucumispora dikerogammari]|nr:Gag-Pol polyprotein [Cucumispora dikerogammari]